MDTVYFVSGLRPYSVQASSSRLEKYKIKLQEEFLEFKSVYPTLPLTQDLYSKIIYIHSSGTDLDVDNMSKPFVDAFRGIIYPDDSTINHRVCSKIKFDDFTSCEIRLDVMPVEVSTRLDELISEKSRHILYFEVGAFLQDMVFIGGKKK